MQVNPKNAIITTIIGISLSTIGSIIFGTNAYFLLSFNWIMATILTIGGGVVLIIEGMKKYSDYREHQTITEKLGLIDGDTGDLSTARQQGELSTDYALVP